MTSHVAASAFGHCLTMVRDHDVATRLAIIAAHRGGRSLTAVLGHARHQSLVHIARNPLPPVVVTPDAGPSEVAWALACTRPAVELAVVDLSGRYGLSRAGLGKTLRLAPSVAASRVAAVSQAWDVALDPALLAWLGAGECAELAGVLDGRARSDAGDLLALSGDVATHTAACATCGDRQRAMASVRLLVTGMPLLPPPPTVMAAVSGSRLQPPVPPPALERRQGRVGLRAVAAVVVLTTTVAVAAVVVGRVGTGGRRDPSVQALTKLPLAAGSLQLTPPTLVLPAGEVALANASAGTVAWEAASDVAWMHVTPQRGRLAPGEKQVLHLRGSPPEGEVRASVKVSGDDGSAVAATVLGAVERPPDLEASADGCRVTAVVEDEGEVVLTLHWHAGGNEQTSPMAPTDTGAVATLPPGSGTLIWWVSGVDGRGNSARTPDVAVANGC